ncbi:hypothetical protein I7I53_06994 [Histoplasma capsulatum var. duboisii H88]|uniref:Uncharacterized protein n=1 Tax=Ajellomyces capsulatus (strain H88) TaxID=544711 RepID=A0A8A1LIK8_AJEC8|nr:hypothetical protein I7I53_06994 [Histoplasma capsulatum var. duboisii H88]
MRDFHLKSMPGKQKCKLFSSLTVLTEQRCGAKLLMGVITVVGVGLGWYIESLGRNTRNGKLCGHGIKVSKDFFIIEDHLLTIILLLFPPLLQWIQHPCSRKWLPCNRYRYHIDHTYRYDLFFTCLSGNVLITVVKIKWWIQCRF